MTTAQFAQLSRRAEVRVARPVIKPTDADPNLHKTYTPLSRLLTVRQDLSSAGRTRCAALDSHERFGKDPLCPVRSVFALRPGSRNEAARFRPSSREPDTRRRP